MHISTSSPELLTFFFISHNLIIQDGSSRHLVFWGCEFDHSGVLTVWNLRSVPNFNFRFRPLVTWSSLHGRDASSHKIWCIYLYPVRSWHFSEIQDGGGIFRLWEFGHSDVLIVWHLCSVPNWVKIYAMVTEIDALMLKTFIWWRHAN